MKQNVHEQSLYQVVLMMGKSQRVNLALATREKQPAPSFPGAAVARLGQRFITCQNLQLDSGQRCCKSAQLLDWHRAGAPGWWGNMQGHDVAFRQMEPRGLTQQPGEGQAVFAA